ncbi:MAG: D-tyrosyl-tRNA(Tyr) deacylase [Chloroflexi bacterium]|nr:D-tyrosyl-tRNA(Tyr) deacylase [Chloroflexota bacterium]
MKVLLQRVARASVAVGDEKVGEIGPGLVALVGVKQGDTQADADYLADKVANLRIFSDAQDKFNLSALDVGRQILAISQFTLLADTRKGRRPSFTDAAPPEIAESLVERFVEALRLKGLRVETGRFRQHMLVEIHNQGPVTILLDSSGSQRN